ncbi:SET domain-containing protein, partial [Martensiomyces pterosporus]
WSGLRDWCKMQGLPKTKLTLAYFPDTFRGMMATRDIDQGEDIIRVPERLLVTASKVRRLTMARAKADSSSAAGMGGWDLSEHQSLAYWVYTEAELGQRSEWHSYISTLPRDFASVPLFVGAKWVLSRLPHSMRQKIAEQQSRLFNDWTHTCASLSAANSRPVTSWRLYVWAWLAVNTRCIHLGRHSAQTDILRPISGDDSIALAPVLDFLNHSGQADVSVRFDEKQKCFSIRTNRPYAKGQEVFISYGPHDNRFMLAEYGFVLAHNPFQFLELDHVAAMGPSDVDTLVATLKQHGLWGDFTISLDALEPSYRLQAALQLLLQAGQ